MDIVFSLDSIITAVGMVDQNEIMIAAVVCSVGASRLLKKVNIQSRILELTSKLTGSSVLTIEKHLENLKEIGDSAFRADKWTAAIQAEHLRGQVCGFYVPRTEVLSASVKIAEQQYVLNLAGATDEEVSKYLHTIGLFGEGYDPNPLKSNNLVFTFKFR